MPPQNTNWTDQSGDGQLSSAAEEMAENVQNISDRMDEIGGGQ